MDEKTYTPPPVQTYRKLTQSEVDLMNEVKEWEKRTSELHANVTRALALEGPTPPGGAAMLAQQRRDMALARTHFEDGFIRMVRAVAKPDAPWA